MRGRKDRYYGWLMVAILLLTSLWVAYDAQASMFRPGWFAGLRTNVWCRTIVPIPGRGIGEFQHYPGKSLARVVKELHLQPEMRETVLNAAEKQTVCFDNWKDAAMGHGFFQKLAEEYPDVIATWPEENFKQAVLMISLQASGVDQLRTMLRVQREQLKQP